MEQIAIIGTGVIGTGWVARLLVNGHQVNAWDPSEGFGKNLKKDIDSLWPILKKTGKLNEELKFNLKICNSLGEACEDANIIQESAPEDINIKTLLILGLGLVANAVGSGSGNILAKICL